MQAGLGGVFQSACSITAVTVFIAWFRYSKMAGRPGVPKDKITIFTIGHSTRKLSGLVSILDSYGIKELVDVRTMPGSRANPQFNGPRLGGSLRKHGVLYVHMKGLGGLRRPLKGSANTYWRNASFRGFADYMQTREFAAALESLLRVARRKPTAIMCAEAVPWRCHRSLIADALAVRGIRVRHIYGATSCRDHEITKAAKARNGVITYRRRGSGGKAASP